MEAIEKMDQIQKMKKLDFNIGDVNDVYSGPVGILWEMLMGEQIHVGGEKETELLAEKAGINKGSVILDVCSALGGPSRHLAKAFGCRITGLDATQKMIEEAIKRTQDQPYSDLIDYRLGNAIDMPFKAETFDVVWGQDAWCYVTDKVKLIQEAYRVLKPSGVIAFTDWLQINEMSSQEWWNLNSFMAFPYIETLDGYEEILKKIRFQIIEKEDLSPDFTEHCHNYQTMLRNDLKPGIVENYGIELFEAADSGLNLWVKAADEGKVGRGRIIARKP
jgi:ubiquinone/menaquinone biosynthesis C-methylase UbiE